MVTIARPKTRKYWFAIQQEHFYIMGRGSLFVVGWNPSIDISSIKLLL